MYIFKLNPSLEMILIYRLISPVYLTFFKIHMYQYLASIDEFILLLLLNLYHEILK